jgi:ADP-ribosylglycohydrolase
VDLTAPADGLVPYEPMLRHIAFGNDAERLSFPIKDVSITDAEGMCRILDAIDSALAADRAVYVHCWGGVGRTGTVVGCWLVRHGKTGEEAVAEVDILFHLMTPKKLAKHRMGSPETEEQRAMIRGWREAEDEARREMSAHVWISDDKNGGPPLGDAARAGWHVDPDRGVLVNEQGVIDLNSVRDAGGPAPAPRLAPNLARGCLLGGAVGDALGAAVEFMTWGEIHRRFGQGGIKDPAEAYGRVGAITDDTQMTLWTAEGILRGLSRSHDRGIGGPPSTLPTAYLRWLYTQDGKLPANTERHIVERVLGRPAREEERDGWPSGWLLGVTALHSRRAPGNTCLSALRAQASMPYERAQNDSKGCGGVMRIAPAALIDAYDEEVDAESAFELACDAASITHGHPTGWLAAGAFAHILSLLRRDVSLEHAARKTIERLERENRAGETIAAIEQALKLAKSNAANSAETVEQLGGGWIAEEALAIALFAAIRAEGDFESGVRLAVNHSGDSDSTGSLAGQLLGIVHGEEAIPKRWLEVQELREEIGVMAEDLGIGWRGSGEWTERYPPW